MTIVAFTGHRPDKLGGYGQVNPVRDKILPLIEYQLKTIRPELAISGMALGVDQWSAELCIKLGIPFTAAVPFVGQENVWPEKQHYRYLLSKAKDIHIVSAGGYASWKLQTRNEWMVDNSDILIAVWDGSSGGTGNCVDYAEKVERTIIRINPHPARLK